MNPELKTWVSQVAPELAQVQVRELPEKTALDGSGRAPVAGWGSVDVLTNSVFREPCTFYFLTRGASRRGRGVRIGSRDRHQGTGQEGARFRNDRPPRRPRQARGLDDRDGIIYRNERLARDFKLASRVEFETPAAGVLEDVQGLCAKVLLLGCVRVRSLVKVGQTVVVHAGTFTSETPLKPIQARD